jgi:hypothetical protein
LGQGRGGAVGGAGQGRRQRVHARAHRHGAGQSQWGRSGDEVGRRKKEKEYFRNIFLRFVFTDNDLRLDFWNHKTRIRRLNSRFIVRVFTGLLEMLRASPAGRRIASERIRTRSTGCERRMHALQRCDASGLTHPARRIPIPNLGQVCVGPDSTYVRPITWRSLPPEEDISLQNPPPKVERRQRKRKRWIPLPVKSLRLSLATG